MRDSKPGTVIGKDGLTGVLLDPLPPRVTGNERVRVRLTDGRTIPIPADIVVVTSDGSFLIPLGLTDIDTEPQAAAPMQQEQVIPVLAEEVVVEKKAVPTGGVRVNRRVLEHDETVELPLRKEHLDVRRVMVDREVDGPMPVRREGETTIIPIVEEVLVVEKRYRLKEEIHVTRTVRQELHTERVTLQRQEANVEQFDAEGRTRVAQPPEARRERRRRKSILGDD